MDLLAETNDDIGIAALDIANGGINAAFDADLEQTHHVYAAYRIHRHCPLSCQPHSKKEKG